MVTIFWWNRSSRASLTAPSSQERSPNWNIRSGSSVTYGSPFLFSFLVMSLLIGDNFLPWDSVSSCSSGIRLHNLPHWDRDGKCRRMWHESYGWWEIRIHNFILNFPWKSPCFGNAELTIFQMTCRLSPNHWNSVRHVLLSSPQPLS